MTFDLAEIKSVIEILFSIASLITIGFSYKVLVYDAKKRKAEVKTEENTAEKVETESDVARIEAVNLLINSSKELILIYKDIISKLEKTITEDSTERKFLKEEIVILTEDRQECREEMYRIKILVAENQRKLAILESQLNKES